MINPTANPINAKPCVLASSSINGIEPCTDIDDMIGIIARTRIAPPKNIGELP